MTSRFPMLETLKIDFWMSENGSVPSSMDSFADAPRLHDFTAGDHVAGKSLTISWNQLRNLDLSRGHCRPQPVLDLLALASNAERVKFEVCTSSIWTRTQAPGSVQLQNLRSLNAVFREVPYIIPFMSILNMPSIFELSFANDRSSVSPRFFWTSLCSLEKLALRPLECLRTCVKLHSPDIIPILENLQQLRVLEVLESDPTFISTRFLKCFAHQSIRHSHSGPELAHTPLPLLS